VAVLFDVDETLVHTGGAGARSWKAAFHKLYGIPADIGQHTSAGETDPQVVRATFTGVMGRDPSDEELDHLYVQYLLHLADDILVSEHYRMLPGAEGTLVALGEAGVLLGLVSGAMEGAARTKLIPANLNRFFIFGAYGSDSPDRAELTGIGIEKAARLHAGLSPSQVFVVGDTPRDLDAAKAAGAVSVGVASGNFSVDELLAAGGNHVLGSLTEPFPGL
jgi:phosphoglycolate phosphatase-like HAD superfamily hydrolase